MSDTYQDLANTTFPDNLDKYKIYQDVNLDNVTYIEQIQSDVAAHNFDGAKTILAAHPELNNVIATAALFQRYEDQIIAVERTWASSIYDKVTHVVSYKGDYSNTATYQMFNVVNYNNKSYQCISTDDITGVLPTNTENWSLLTIQGISGTGMAFYSSWTSTQEYKVQDCVPYGNKLWVCITANTNQEPDTSPDYWKQIIVVPRQIIWSKNQPENQEENDIWNQTSENNNSYITHVCQGNNSYVTKEPTSEAQFISTSDGSNVQTKLDEDNKISTYVHSYDSATKIHNLQGTGSNIKFLATADYHDGDTWTVNGQTVTASMQDNQILFDSYFVSENWIYCHFDGTKLNFKQSGSDIKLNVFAQPDEPTEKNGVWLKTSEKETFEKVVFDTNVWAAGQWQNPSLAKDLPTSRDYICCEAINESIYIFGGVDNDGNILKTVLKYDTTTNTFSSMSDLISPLYDIGHVAIGNNVYLFGGQSSLQTQDDCILRYDVEENKCYQINNLSYTTRGATCINIGNYIYIFDGVINSKYYKYNITTNECILLGDIPTDTPINYSSAYNAPNCNEIIFIGGERTDDEISMYDFKLDQFQSLMKSLPYGYNSNTNCRFGNNVLMCDHYSESWIYSLENNTYKKLDTPFTLTGYGGCCLVNDTIYLFGANNTDNGIYHITTECFKLTAKQYSNSPSIIFYYLPSDITHKSSLIKSKLLDYLPIYFKDCMIYNDNNISFPSYYIGDGNSWVKQR